MNAPDRIWINWTPADAEDFPTAVGATTVLSHINTMAHPVEYTRTDLADATITAQAAEIASLQFALAETEALEMQHGAVVERQAAEIARLREALSLCVSSLRESTTDYGICCCGDNMDGHAPAIDCGHVAIDQGEYDQQRAISAAREALKAAS